MRVLEVAFCSKMPNFIQADIKNLTKKIQNLSKHAIVESEVSSRNQVVVLSSSGVLINLKLLVYMIRSIGILSLSLDRE